MRCSTPARAATRRLFDRISNSIDAYRSNRTDEQKQMNSKKQMKATSKEMDRETDFRKNDSEEMMGKARVAETAAEEREEEEEEEMEGEEIKFNRMKRLESERDEDDHTKSEDDHFEKVG